MLCAICDKRKPSEKINVEGSELFICEFCKNVLYGENLRNLYGGMLYELFQKRLEYKQKQKQKQKVLVKMR